tara:strand:+ start:547 stop:1083 length:537 start_codon:yes stop_codon:yes gene_type:complete
MDNFYNGLVDDPNDLEKSVGEVFRLEESIYFMVPFIHCGHQFLTYFSPIDGTPDIPFEIFKQAIESNSNHTMGDNPYVLKFGLREHLNSGKMFDPSNSSIPNIHFTFRSRLVHSVIKLINTTDAEEFYFIAGGDDEARISKLDRWYKRISDKVAPEQGLEPIHSQEDNGGWYGYKRVY